ncbi:conserved oligomeric Golgi complex component, COG2 family protein [Candida albicans]|uniref:Conserved oligomeric Golgi complex subunit 2 n=1 Tax=Candida albicans TaxID=5476 RepID=A0A8H6BV43_CANAX|nr:conserved oligomeric Golgi complex component, COG2 family protein [Candida albicans]
MSQEFDILNGTDEFPYPTSIIQTDFKNFDSDSHEIDLFLYKNYRFSSIDSIIKELTELSTNLNQNLLDLVNDDYHDFIDLGKSINDGLDLINAIVEDLKNFEIELVNYYKKFSDLDNRLYQILQNRKFLNNLKTCIKLNLILHDQITEFDNCMNNQIQEENNIQGLNQLKTLTSLYLSINNIEFS